MEITSGWVSAAAGVVGVATTIAGMWIRGAFQARDEKIAALERGREIDAAANKATQKLLFDKFDAVCDDLQAYKLHVAETYVNQAALEKMLAPIERRLENIEKDLREGGK